ncbi:MAG: PIN domain-containing protein [archaeon GBS-70-058]|nr:PIN domain-containing protein [Candidatus Culexarchaeum nevadense]
MVVCYVDSSVLVSALTPTESRHKESVKTIEDIKKSGGMLITSTYAFMEVVNVVCRRIISGQWNLIEPLNILTAIVGRLGHKALCETLTSMLLPLLEQFGVTLIDDQDFYVLKNLNGANIAKIFKEAVKLTWINCRTKDLLHVAIASLMSKKYGVKCILTADEEDFSKVKNTLKENLNIEVEIIHHKHYAE